MVGVGLSFEMAFASALPFSMQVHHRRRTDRRRPRLADRDRGRLAVGTIAVSGIDLARAIPRNPRILILDEATGALDPGTEATINQTLARIGRGRMVVTVTHRLAAAADADCIHVLDQGRLVESGRHDGLLALGGHDARLWAKQSGFELSQEGDAAVVSPARLGRVPLFDQLDEETLALAAPLFVTECHPEGRLVICRGDEGDHFYILVRGAAEVLADEAEGIRRRVAVLEAVGHFWRDRPFALGATHGQRAYAHAVYASIAATASVRVIVAARAGAPRPHGGGAPGPSRHSGNHMSER